MSGRSEFRLRVGDYRIIYRFDLAWNEMELITLGHVARSIADTALHTRHLPHRPPHDDPGVALELV